MKKIISILFLAASISSASAYEWFFDASSLVSNVNVNWSTLGGDENTDGKWFRYADPLDVSSAKIYIRNALPSSTDSINFGVNTGGADRINFIFDQAETVLSGLTFSNTTTYDFIYSTAKTNKLIINGDIKRTSSTSPFIYNLDLTVNGNVDWGANTNVSLCRNTGNPNYRIYISGNMKGGNVYVQANGLISARPLAERTFQNGLANPDIFIGGIVSSGRLYVSNDNLDSFISVGGVSGDCWLYRNQTVLTGASKTYVILNNVSDQISTGGIRETGDNTVWIPDYGRMQIVSNGTHSQTFSASSLRFTGGAKVISGTLKVNFAQNISTYTYFADTTKNISVKAYKDAAATIQTTYSHGDLEMLGGTFASADGEATYGAFRFTNVKYTNGVIKLRLMSASKMDSIDLTGFYFQNASDPTVAVDGGTVEKLGQGKVTFDFGNNLDWLIDSQENGGKGVKVIAWDSANKTALLESDFAGNSFGENSAIFTVADDGLYVKYGVVVPEPATLATIFGAVVIAFAFWRRRR